MPHILSRAEFTELCRPPTIAGAASDDGPVLLLLAAVAERARTDARQGDCEALAWLAELAERRLSGRWRFAAAAD